MMKSMTAFGRAKVEGESRDITVEIRSVNSRYFDCTVKMPRAYTYLEEKVKSTLKNTITRGKIDVFVTVEEKTAGVSSVHVDMELARAYITALEQLRDAFSLKDDITVMKVASNRELFTYDREAEDADRDWEMLSVPLLSAIASFSESREAEGKKTEADIREKLASIRADMARIAEISRSEKTGYADKLKERIHALLDENGVVVDEMRILTEVAIYADKIAIDEELARLDSHMSAFDTMMQEKEPSGRKLDFLMQEMNRETNTIGSKANNAAIARLVVHMKGELEKIREQIQNVE